MVFDTPAYQSRERRQFQRRSAEGYFDEKDERITRLREAKHLDKLLGEKHIATDKILSEKLFNRSSEIF